MPFTQISLRKGKSLEYRRELMEEVYLAMLESINIPENDRFATVTELEDGNFNNSGDYLGISRSDDIVYIQITLNGGRTTDKKKAQKGALRKDRGTLKHEARHSNRRCRD